MSNLANRSGRRPATKFSTPTLWIVLASLLVGTATMGSVVWIFDHPYGTWWDEAGYINRAYLDVDRFRSGGVVGLARTIIGGGRSIPPAFRILVLPFTLSAPPDPAILRLVSLAAWWVSLFFIYLAGRRLAGPAAGAFSVSILAVSPVIVDSSKQYLTEFTVYLAVAAMLYFLFRNWNAEGDHTRGWVALGLALGLGALAKTSFILVSAPMVLIAAILKQTGRLRQPDLPFVVKSIGLGAALGLLWWLPNFRRALGYTHYAWTYFRDSLGPPASGTTLVKWLQVSAESLFGPGSLLLVVAILMRLLIKAKSGDTRDSTVPKMAIWACLAAALPLLLVAYLGQEHKVRLISPSLLPIAIALGVLATSTGWTRSRWFTGGAVILFCLQSAATILPLTRAYQPESSQAAVIRKLGGGPLLDVMRRSEQWDWSVLRTLCQARQIRTPSIAFLGSASTFNFEQIRFPWIKAGEQADVRWLWRYEDGPINWHTLMTNANANKVVLVAPDLIGNPAEKEDLDNRHNVEFHERMRSNPLFAEADVLQMGRLTQLKLFVFVRRGD